MVRPKDLSPGNMCVCQALTRTELASPSPGPLLKGKGKGEDGRGWCHRDGCIRRKGRTGSDQCSV